MTYAPLPPSRFTGIEVQVIAHSVCVTAAAPNVTATATWTSEPGTTPVENCTGQED